jgi:hypothetical protein
VIVADSDGRECVDAGSARRGLHSQADVSIQKRHLRSWHNRTGLVLYNSCDSSLINLAKYPLSREQQQAGEHNIARLYEPMDRIARKAHPNILRVSPFC